ALDPGDLDAGGFCFGSSLLEQLGDEVEPGHRPAGACSRDGCVARSAGDVEHGHPRLDPRTLDKKLADVRYPLGEAAVIPFRPDCALPRLELVQPNRHGEPPFPIFLPVISLLSRATVAGVTPGNRSARSLSAGGDGKDGGTVGSAEDGDIEAEARCLQNACSEPTQPSPLLCRRPPIRVPGRDARLSAGVNAGPAVE